MKKRSKKDIEKQVDKIQDKIEKRQLRAIQKEYKTKVPAFIWLIKIGLVIGIFQILNLLSKQRINLFVGGFNILFAVIFLIGLVDRRRWSLYLGLFYYLYTIISYVVLYFINKEIYIVNLVVGVPMSFIFALILLWHKDYLNK